MTHRFTWGDGVRVRASAPSAFRPGELGSICAVEEITDEVRARSAGVEIGTVIYLVEFGDGVAVEVAEAFLEADEANGS